jgi:hypothetical protein
VRGGKPNHTDVVNVTFAVDYVARSESQVDPEFSPVAEAWRNNRCCRSCIAGVQRKVRRRILAERQQVAVAGDRGNARVPRFGLAGRRRLYGEHQPAICALNGGDRAYLDHGI